MSTSPAISSSSDASTMVSTAGQQPEIVPVFHADGSAAALVVDTMSSAATDVPLTNAVPGEAQLRSNPWLTVQPENGAAALVAGAAGASDPAPASGSGAAPRSSEEPRRREFCGCLDGWMPAFMVDFFEFICKILCCCLPSSSPPSDPEASSEEPRGLELREMNSAAPAAAAGGSEEVQGINLPNANSAAPAAAVAVVVPAESPALEGNLQRQIAFAFAAELEPMKNVDGLQFPFKKVVLLWTDVEEIRFGWENVSNDRDDFDYVVQATKKIPSKEQMDKITTFKLAFVTFKEEENAGKTQLIVDFNIYSYNSKASEKPAHEHHSCSSAEGFTAITKLKEHNHLLGKWLNAKDDYKMGPATEDAQEVEANEGDGEAEEV